MERDLDSVDETKINLMIKLLGLKSNHALYDFSEKCVICCGSFNRQTEPNHYMNNRANLINQVNINTCNISKGDSNRTNHSQLQNLFALY